MSTLGRDMQPERVMSREQIVRGIMFFIGFVASLGKESFFCPLSLWERARVRAGMPFLKSFPLTLTLSQGERGLTGGRSPPISF